MPIPTTGSPHFGAEGCNPPGSDMPPFALQEFDFSSPDDNYPSASHPEFLDLDSGSPFFFADPTALVRNEPPQLDPATKTSNCTFSSQRGSTSSSSSHRSGDSLKTSQTSGDLPMPDSHVGSWHPGDTGVPNGHSTFNMYMDSMDTAPLEDMSQVFDFESASSSPSLPNNARSVLPSPQFSSNHTPASPRVKRHKGRHQTQPSLSQSMNKLMTSGSRETSPTSNPHMNPVTSPSAVFQNTPPPENQQVNFFASLPAGLGVPAVWPNVAPLQGGAQTSQMQPNQANGIPTTQSHLMSPYAPQQGMPSVPRPRLFVQPTPLKSRVETQIPIKLTIHHLPPGIKRIHLPTHTISKPKLLSKPPAVRAPDMLELYTMLVCTSAMTDPIKRERAFARAAAAQYDYSAGKTSEEKQEDDEAKPQNGGEVRICSGCITRERKRAGRKKHRKPEEEDLWNRFERQRVIVFNTQEVKEWQPVTAHMADPTGAGLRESVPEGTMQVDAPMRIACYCRHHGEKAGFQVIFTVKDFQDNVVAQQLSSSIMITDDHKTHLPAASTMQNGNNANGAVAATQPTTTADMNAPVNTPVNPPMAFQQQPPCSDPRDPPNKTPFTFPAGHSSLPPVPCAQVNAAPKIFSRQPSPSQQTTQQPGPMSRKRKASGTGKVPNGLTMTQIEKQTSPLSSGMQNEPGTLSAAPSPFSPDLGSFPLTADALYGQSGLPSTGAPTPAFTTGGPPTPSSHTAEQMIFPSNGPLSMDNPPQLFSAPATANPSRAPSPSQLREMSQGLYGSSTGTTPNRGGPQPMIYKIIPGEGPKSGGVEVTILGSGFTNDGLEVMFGENRAATTTFWGETSLLCLLPPSARAGAVPVSLRHPADPGRLILNGTQQPLFRYVDDDEHRLIRTALTVLGNKIGGKITDVADIARNILYGPAAANASWGSSGPSGPTNGQAPNNNGNNNNFKQESDVEGGLLRVLELIDLDDSPNKARINLRRSSGQTMLHLACSLGMARFVAGLISRGANVDLRDKGGFTPLHMAAMNDHPEIVRRLINKGADPTMRTLSGLTPADVAQSRDVIQILRHIETHARSRSGGSHHSRVNSASSLRSLWDPPSMTPVKRQNVYQETTEDDSESDDIDSDEEERDYGVMMSPGGRRPRLEVPGSRAAVPPAPISPGVAMAAFRDHFVAQLHQLQQSMAMQLQNLPQFQVPQMLQMPHNMQTMLPDAQAHLQAPSVVQRISSLVPNIRGSGDQSSTESNKWPSFFGSKETPPPSYEEIYPQKDLDTKQASAARAAVDCEADNKCAALYDQDVEEVEAETTSAEASGSGSGSRQVPELLHVGRKKAITREQQENLQRAHAASLKTGSRDKMLWFFWVPVLVLILGAMLFNVIPPVLAEAAQTAVSYATSGRVAADLRQLAPA